MVEAARVNCLDIPALIASKHQTIRFNDLSLMRDQLDEYVGEVES